MTKLFSIETIKLAGSIVLCMLTGFIGSFATRPKIPGWYASLQKPSFNPPPWLFGPVWTALYLSMAVAAWMVWRRGGPAATAALSAFAVQLAFNVAWSGLFFGLRSPAAAMLDIVLLWLAIAATIACFLRVSVPAGLIMAPYLAWVSFAAALNFAIWRMN